MTLVVSPTSFVDAAPAAPALRKDVTLIELGDQAIGLAVRERDGFRFFAAVPALGVLDSQIFPSLKALRQAARDARKRRGQHSVRVGDLAA